jgi:hypothetical protein
MHLFVRRARLAGGQSRAAMMWAEEITDRVNQVTGLGFTLHAQVFSAEVGELVWATGVPDLLTLEQGVQKLQVDDFYMAEQDRGHSFMLTPPNDVLQTIVHGDMGEIPVGGYTNVVTSVCGAGRITEAVTNAIELADHVTKLTGASTIVSLNRTGPYGQVTWSTSYPGMASFEAAQGAVDADPDWPGMVDRLTGGGVFTPDPMASMQSMYLRLH